MTARRIVALAAAMAVAVSVSACDTARPAVTGPQPTPASSAAEPAAEPSTAIAESAPVDRSSLGPGAAAYVDAVNDRDLDALVAAFAPAGRVRDVSRMIEGPDRIRTWAGNEVIGGSLRVIRVDRQRADGQRLLVRWAPAGSAGWDAFYDFTYDADGRILLADLQYA